MPLTTSTTIRLHYDIAGTGAPLCLINGYRQSSAAWPQPFIARLAQRHTVITFDNRGTGRSDKPPDGYAFNVQARDIIGLVDELGFARVHLLGFSMGGAIAQEVVAACPERIDRLVLFGTFCGGIVSQMAPWSVLRLLFATDGLTPEQAAQQVLPVTYTPAYLAAHADEVERQMQRELIDPTPGFVSRRQMEALRRFDRFRDLAKIHSPTLVTTGAEDRLVSPRNSMIMARHIPHARLELLADLGHRAIWEAPEEMAELIGDFLAGPRCKSVRDRSPSTADLCGP